MKIYFKKKTLQKCCNSETESIKKWGRIVAAKLRQRLSELKAAENLQQTSHLPPARCHELTGNRKGQFSVDLVHPFRLVFKPYEEPIPKTEDGSIDRVKVTAIIIVEVVDYHD